MVDTPNKLDLEYSLNFQSITVPKDVIIQVHSSGNWVIYNVFTQDSLAITTNGLRVLSLIEEENDKGKTINQIKQNFVDEKFLVWDISIFSQVFSSGIDPSRIIREYKDWPTSQNLDLFSFVALLLEKHLVVSDQKKYKELLGLKTSFLDKAHLGNYHQQMGKKLVLDMRVDPSDWWIKQKFTEDYKDLRNNLYKAVQENFLKKWIKEKINASHTVIDLGCGIGYYSQMMGELGAKVIGIDPNEKYIHIANKNASNSVSFKRSGIGNKGDLDWIPSSSADFIIMIDALLFYFVPPNYVPSKSLPKPDINILFNDIKRILKPTGKFISIEPNGIFLFRPWLGEVDRPFTVVTEYTNPWYNVVANYTKIIQAFIKGGFIIKNMEDILVDEKYYNVDPRGTNFAKEFPLWCFFELGVN
ncbi:class I SAM-dependent methyltransferase [Candidatus Woesearchaeota archaeon]|nr:hypothetical protein [uncultured archaeon]MBS3124371.1 class I SAM-dependent methyltransferase [Candidatus Woesearchaeota archaeon]